MQLAGDRRQPGLHGELHQGREQRQRVDKRKPRTALEKILAGEDPEKVLRGYERQQRRREAQGRELHAGGRKPRTIRRRSRSRPTAKPKQPAAPADPDEAVLDYLLGAEE